VALRAAPTYRLERVPSPIGEVVLVMDDEGRLRTLGWSDLEERWRGDLQRRHGAGVILRPGPTRSAAAEALARYFAGDLQALAALPVEPGGTEFQRAVWQALRDIPPGTTFTYAQLAGRIGRPSAVRAVGHANGANPISLVIPCHRLVGADGSLTGFGGGLARKAWLLAHEGCPVG
jgi:methylated-DNA-[protein]-cysteine S-methyltransferase